jgi:hypothetical protein
MARCAELIYVNGTKSYVYHSLHPNEQLCRLGDHAGPMRQEVALSKATTRKRATPECASSFFSLSHSLRNVFFLASILGCIAVRSTLLPGALARLCNPDLSTDSLLKT